jgi:hypothetical protein
MQEMSGQADTKGCGCPGEERGVVSVEMGWLLDGGQVKGVVCE